MHPLREVKSGFFTVGNTVCPCLFCEKRLRPTMPETEADTCRMYVLPKLYGAGWDGRPNQRAAHFTDGRVIPTAKRIRRGKQKRADYRLRYTRDFPIAIVEAKAGYKTAGEGLSRRRNTPNPRTEVRLCHQRQGNHRVRLPDRRGADDRQLSLPRRNFGRGCAAAELTDDKTAERLLTPCLPSASGKHLATTRNRHQPGVKAILRAKARPADDGDRHGQDPGRLPDLLEALERLWNRDGRTDRKPRILYLADRNILIDDPKDKTFAPFGDARWKIENGEISKGREMYFAIYQAIAEDERPPRSLPGVSARLLRPHHRGRVPSGQCPGREQLAGNPRILRARLPARHDRHAQRDDNADTYPYFGNPIYTYSLRQGIDDGFLAPYRVHRIVTT